MRNLKEQSGAVILLGVIITTVILIIGMGVSILVISEIKQSKNVSRSATAYYLAEYGIEDGLYEVRKRGKSINSIDKNNIVAANGFWSRTASDKKDEVSVDLLENNKSIYINLYNPDAVDSNNITDYHADIEAISVECKKISTSSIVRIKIEIEKLNLDNMELELSDDIMPNTTIHFCKSPDESESYLKYNNLSILPNYAMRIKITAITGDVHNLIFKAYTDNNFLTQAQIMDKHIIKSSGTYSHTKAGLQAEMELEPPW